MAKVAITTIKDKFKTGDEPTQADFEDFIDSTYNVNDGTGLKFQADDGTYKFIPDLIGFLHEYTITVPIIKDGTLILADNKCNFPIVIEGETVAKTFDVTGGIVTLVDLHSNYIVVDHDTNTFVSLQDPDLIDYVRYIPYAECYRSGVNVHIQTAPLLAINAVDKGFERKSRTDRYVRQSGLTLLAVDNQLNITLDAGVVWTINKKYNLLPITTATDGFFCHHDNSVWHNQRLSGGPKVNNIQYDNSINLIDLTDNFWNITYLFRGIEDQDHCYLVLEDEEFSSMELAQAHNGIVPLPELISSHAMLVGRIICQKNNSYNFLCESYFNQTFNAATSVTSHSQLNGLDYATSGHTGFAKDNIVSYATNSTEEASAFANGAKIVIRTDLL